MIFVTFTLRFVYLSSCSTSLSLFFFFFVCFFFCALVEPVPESINFPSEEERILQLWKDKDCFQECLKQSKNRPR